MQTEAIIRFSYTSKSPISRHSMQSCILIYYRLRKREPLIALGSHQVGRGALISASEVWCGEKRTDLNNLAVRRWSSNSLVAFNDTRSESTGICQYPMPTGGRRRRIRSRPLRWNVSRKLLSISWPTSLSDTKWLHLPDQMTPTSPVAIVKRGKLSWHARTHARTHNKRTHIHTHNTDTTNTHIYTYNTQTHTRTHTQTHTQQTHTHAHTHTHTRTQTHTRKQLQRNKSHTNPRE